MRLPSLWQEKKSPTLSFELFPARTPKGAENLEKAIDELAGLNPDFVSVTFGAGGSTRDGSYQLIKKLKQEKGLEVVAYFACFGLGPDQICEVLDSYRDLGVETVLAVRGDEPKGEEGFEPHPQSLAHASDLVEFIGQRYGFCVGAAGYPEGHIEAASKEKDLEYAGLKVKNGAEYIITNYTYDNKYFFDYRGKLQAMGIKAPILPGVMPIFSVKMMRMLAGLCGAEITDEIEQGLAAIDQDDPAAVREFGAGLAVRQCRELLKSGAPGIHIYTMDKSASSMEIVTRLREEGLI